MPVICWAPMALSAQDPTTIAQYITRKVLEHDIDPNAHNLNDYALYNHRSDVDLDHVDYCISVDKIRANAITTEKLNAYAVVADKIAANAITADKINAYAVTSDKISSDWIIGKKFETDPGVGPGTDGVITDPNGIMMYQSGVRKVNIPKSGNPEFFGDLIVNSISNRKFIFQPTFESLDNWYINSNGAGGAVSSNAGFVILQSPTDLNASTLLYYLDSMWMAGKFSQKNPSLECNIVDNVVSSLDMNIMLGQYNPLGGHQRCGFHWDYLGQQMYVQRMGVGYPLLQYPINWKPWWTPYQFKIAITGAGRYMNFYINNSLIQTIDTPGFYLEQQWDFSLSLVNRRSGFTGAVRFNNLIYMKDF